MVHVVALFVYCGLTSRSAILQLYSNGKYVQCPMYVVTETNTNIAAGTPHAIGNRVFYFVPRQPRHRFGCQKTFQPPYHQMNTLSWFVCSGDQTRELPITSPTSLPVYDTAGFIVGPLCGLCFCDDLVLDTHTRD